MVSLQMIPASGILLLGVLLAAWEAAWGQLRYSVPEEKPKGSFVGDVAKDLGLQLQELSDRGVRILNKGRMHPAQS
uniref:Cadherin N-terminal domain-containing protein n=1 Tax=Serinus canaria TaxID=9135 RepID=A0A8C9N1K5_SERCA